MYSTCIFCHSSLGANDVIEHFPVGKRLAFDAGKGRLWVICGSCARWNLSPLDERWEAIEEAERIFRASAMRITTDNIGLARLPSGVQLVRIGRPLRPEFAAWRYGTRFARRRMNVNVVVGSAAAAAALTGAVLSPILVPALVTGTLSLVAFPGATTIMGAIPMVGALAARDYLLDDHIVTRFRNGRHVIVVREKHVRDAEFHMTGDVPTMRLPHDNGCKYYDGTEAMYVATVLLASANRFGGSGASVRDAVACIERAGDAPTFLRHTSRSVEWRAGRIVSVLARMRRLGALHLGASECLALEMSLHEESERRALEGELDLLRDAWKEAEQVAAIADGMFDPPAGATPTRTLRPAPV
ncbi:MAG TPA: hypothetical protein VFK16_02665 [Gemmatimonadaceae bacterium]|jgi:hypothetical protein|nr:hypothetical protein [Gemmatimonadaceae bacterium]